MKPSLYIGTMSGTSADGLDIVIVEFASADSFKLIHRYYCKYPENLRTKIQFLQTCSPNNLFEKHQHELNLVDSQLATFYAKHIEECLQDAKIEPMEIIAIGNHGQTILHQPNSNNPFSLQLCNGQQLANFCKTTVINNFRQADIESGGQGAPLMPAFHQTAFSELTPCAILNLGGIANTTLLLDNNTIIGFDNGPANTLLDAWTEKNLERSVDENGNWGRQGKLNLHLLDTLMKHQYFSEDPPKSTGQDQFNLAWLESELSNFDKITPADVQTTLYDLTAKSIAQDLNKFGQGLSKVFLCGGGTKNSFLIERLKHYANQDADHPVTISDTNTIGIDPDWVEAIGFAWLGFCKINNLTGNIPSVTGAREKRVLGDIHRPN